MKSSVKAMFAVYLVVVVMAMGLISISSIAAQDDKPTDWSQFNFDPQKSGTNPNEHILDAKSLKRVKKMFDVTFEERADSPPVYLSGVTTSTGVKDLVFVNTMLGRLVAMDSVTGEIIWSQFKPADNCIVNNGVGREKTYPCFTTSGPAIDPNRQFVYAYSPAGYVHKYKVEDGTEIVDGGWPELTTRKPYDEKGSSNLAIATARNGTSYLYVTHASYGFPPPGALGEYQGSLTTINLATGAQNVFNGVCSDKNDHLYPKGTQDPYCNEKESGMWGRSGVVYDAETDRIYVATGNGPFSPDDYHWGNSVLALNPDGSSEFGIPLDSFTPEGYEQLDTFDLDVGSVSPLMITAPKGSKIPRLLMQGSKASQIWLINIADFSGTGQPGSVGGEVAQFKDQLPQMYMMRNAMVSWTNPEDGTVWVYYVNGTDGMIAFQIKLDADGNPFLEKQWANANRGTSPIIANGILYYNNSDVIRALNPKTGVELWSTSGNGTAHWQSLIVVNGIIYVADDTGGFHAYAIDGDAKNTLATQRPK